jgi:hypothetical protein
LLNTMSQDFPRGNPVATHPEGHFSK